MKGTYRKIKSETDKRTFPAMGQIDVKQQMESVFFQCQIYWTMHQRYEYLKIVQNNLQGRIPSNAKYDSDGLMKPLDCMITVELWRYYKTQKNNTDTQDYTTVDQDNQEDRTVAKNKKSASASSFFRKYLGKDWEATRQELVKMGISRNTMEEIDYTREMLVDDIQVTYFPLYINKIELDEKNKYVDMLEDALDMQLISMEECVDAVLSQYTENKILTLLEQDTILSYAELFMQLGMLRGILTDETTANEIEKNGPDEAKYFTKNCPASLLALMNAVNKILQKYTLENHSPRVEELRSIIDNGFKIKDKKLPYIKLQNELYQNLEKECRKWIAEYRADWKALSEDPSLLELQYRLKVAGE